MPSRAPYQGSEAWLAERRTGYGASDAPTLVEGDEADWRQLHGEKLGLLPSREANETMQLGHELEDVIARLGAEREGWRLRRVNRLVRHPALPYVFASLDRLQVGGARRPVEVKKWAVKGSEWGPAGSDVVPVRILYQLQQQAAVTGADAIEVVVLFGGAKLERFTVGRDGTIIDELLELETAAWAYVARGEMPPWPGQVPKRVLLLEDEIEADQTLLQLALLHEQADELAKRADQELTDAKDRIRAVLADAGGARGVLRDGRRLSIAHRPSDPSPKTDWKLVASAYRKAIEQGTPIDVDAIESMFTVTPAGTRPLRITIGKEARNAA